MSRPLSLDRRREVVLEYTYIEAKAFDAGDTILRTAIRKQVGSIVKRLHREGTIERLFTKDDWVL
jgi:hypothetical protein